MKNTKVKSQENAHKCKKRLKKEKGITLIALVVTIVVLLILAAISISLLFGENGLIAKAKEARDKTKEAREKEMTEMDDALASIDSELIKAGGDIEVKDIEDIDDSVNLPEKKSDSELIKLGYIPIYTTEQFQQIATETSQYQINDLQGNNKGKYDMKKNAKYAIINDIDFADVTGFHGIAEFRGELEGNGCILSNLAIDNTTGYTQEPPSVIFKNDSARYNWNAGIISSADGAIIQNLEIDNSTFKSNDSTGTIVGKCDNTKINNCYAKNCESIAYANAGGIVGATWANNTIITNCKTINSTGKAELSFCRYSGMVSTVFGNIEMDNCSTYVTENSDNNKISGLIYQILRTPTHKMDYNEELNVKISNCKIQNVKQSNYNSSFGGIVCFIIGKNDGNVTIENCSAKNIEGKNASGIVGYIENINNLDVNKCKVQNLNGIDGDYSSNVGGIIGYVNGILIVNISNNTSKKLNMNGNFRKIGGIISGIERSEQVSIKNCIAQEAKINSGSMEAISGIVAQIGGFIGSDNIKSVDIENCIVNNINESEIKSKHEGGIAGLIQSTNENSQLLINNCITKNYRGNGGTVGGIVGQTEMQTSVISNCSAFDLNETGERCGGILGEDISKKDISVRDCSVDNFKAIINSNSGAGAGIVRILFGI